MIPDFTLSDVIPPVLPGAAPTDTNAVSPYVVTANDLASKLGSTPARIEILIGLLKYRRELRSIGVVSGFQWIDGSFVENVEKAHGRPPNDIDIVTFAERPLESASDLEWMALIKSRPDIFSQNASKASYKCDAYFVDLSLSGSFIVGRTAYWYGLFSHQRATAVWKGMIQLDVNDPGSEAALLASLEKNGEGR